MRKLSLLVLLGVIAISSAATTCGNAAWWTDIQANLIDKWDQTDSNVKTFNTLKTAYDSKVATTVTQTHEVTKGHCKSYFTAATDQSCCSSADHEKMINLAVKASIAAAVPRGKGDACQSLKFAFQKALVACNKAKNADKKSDSTASLSSDSSSSERIALPSGSNSSSILSPSTGAPDSVQKIKDKADKAGKKAEAKSKKALGDAAIAIAQQIRGTLCAICGDPDKQSSIFDPATKTWYVNTESKTEHIKKITQSLQEAKKNGKDCLDFFQYDKKRNEKKLGTCEGAVQVVADFKLKQTPSETDADFDKSANNCFNPLTTGCVAQIIADAPENRRVMRSNMRILAGATYQSTSTGGSKSSSNTAEDGGIVVGGETITSINQEAATADKEYEALGGGTVDYNQALKAEDSGNTELGGSLNKFFGIILILLSIMF